MNGSHVSISDVCLWLSWMRLAAFINGIVLQLKLSLGIWHNFSPESILAARERAIFDCLKKEI